MHRGSTPSSEASRSDSLGIEPFVDAQRESGKRIENAGKAAGEKGLETVGA